MTDSSPRLPGWFAELRRRKVVRVAVVYVVIAWVLIQVVDATFEPIGLPTWASKLVIVLAVLGFPLACGLAWAFDVTARGIERAAPGSPTRTDASTQFGATVPAVPAATTLVAPEPRVVPVRYGSQSVAILPLVDMSAEHDQDYFCDGIAEEIITTLCCVRGLKVASRTSAFQFKGKAGDVREIGRALAVDTVLEGSVRKAGDRVRISAQLVNAADGYHLWSESFDRRLEDIFAIQEEIAQQIAKVLRSSLTSGEAAQTGRGGTASSDAYEYYLRGRALLRRHGADRFDAKQMFLRSISIDPGFALAHAGLAAALAEELYWRQAKDPNDIAAALRAVQRAEQLQPGLVEVLVARGSLLSAQGRNDEATAAFEAAIDRAPSFPDTYYWYARHAFSLGKHAKAAKLFTHTVELEPMNYTAWGLLGAALDVLGDTQRSRDAELRCVQLIDRQLELYPDDVRAMQFGASANATLSRRDRAIELIESALALQPDTSPTLYNVACAYARLGETDKALDFLERWADTGAGGAWIREEPDFFRLRSEPRFAAVLKRTGGHGAA